MNFKYVAISVIALSLFSCNQNNNAAHDHNHGATEECGSKTEEHEEHVGEHAEPAKEVSHEGEIVLTVQQAKRFGVKTVVATLSPFNKVLKVTGEILPAQGDESVVVAPSAGIIRFNSSINLGIQVGQGSSVCSISGKNMVGGDINEAAKVNYLTAKREIERLTPLYKDKIVTEREYNVALNEYEKAKIAYSSKSTSGSTATASISGVVSNLFVKDGEYVEAGAPIIAISKNAKLILKADVPERFLNQISTITTANFSTTYNKEVQSLSSLGGKLIRSGTAVTSTPGYISVYFEFNNKGNNLAGSFADIFLISNSDKEAIAIPIQSITEESGKFFVYVKIDKEVYTKHLVELGASDGNNIEIKSGLSKGDEVVTDGAVIVKLAASSGKIPDGHNHQH